MNLVVKPDGQALWGTLPMRCAVGRGGIIAVEQKTEGDGATPAGIWPMREIIYRADRVTLPSTRLPMRAMQPNDGWCENSSDPLYNQAVRHPYVVPVDQMWRQDQLYDVVVVLGYNDAPVVPGKGSAIFLHLARPDFSPSAGCVTLALEDISKIVAQADISSCVEILNP